MITYRFGSEINRMGVKVATGCLNWSQPSNSHSSPSSTLSSAISSPSSKRHCLTFTDVSFVCRHVHRSSVFGKKLSRSRSCEALNLSKRPKSIKRILSANFGSESFYSSSEIHEFGFECHQFFEDDDNHASEQSNASVSTSEQQILDPFSGKVINWSGDLITTSIERKMKSMDLPISIRIIQKKKQLEDGFREAGEFAYCSMKKAFSSMVFIIRELQSYTLQMREVLFFEDLEGILIRVQKEMNASFVWLFQQVFSHTPNLMVCVMILLANYSVYSMSNHIGIVTPSPATTMEIFSTSNTNFDSVNSGGKTASIGGTNGGGGGKYRPVSSGTDGNGKFRPDGYSSSTVNPTGTDEESVSSDVSDAEEWGLWQSVVAEAEEMQKVAGDDGINLEIRRMFVSPVTVKMPEEVDAEVHFKTELLYQTGLSKEPDNPLLLANYAQFLYLFSQDHKRAEEYFKKALQDEPKDAEALNKYATFLWHAKNDLWAAEETFLEAISADPNNPIYRATYANFLWSNGADDTCFPLESPDEVN